MFETSTKVSNLGSLDAGARHVLRSVAVVVRRDATVPRLLVGLVGVGQHCRPLLGSAGTV